MQCGVRIKVLFTFNSNSLVELRGNMIDKIFIKIVKLISNKQAFLKTRWIVVDDDEVKVEFQICIEDDKSIWKGNKEFRSYQNNADYTSIEKALQSSQQGEVKFNLDERKLKFIVTETATSSQSVDLILFRINIQQVEVNDVSSMYLESLQEQSKLLELQSQLDEKDRLIATMQTSIDDSIRKNREHEQKLLPTFLRLLNSKKSKIQELENELLKLKQEDLASCSAAKFEQSPSPVKSAVRHYSKTPEKKKAANSPSEIQKQATPPLSLEGWIFAKEKKLSISPSTSKSPSKSPRKRTPQKPIQDFNFTITRKSTRTRKLSASEEIIEQGESSKNIVSAEKSAAMKISEDLGSQEITGLILSDKFKVNLSKRFHSDKSSQSSNESDSSKVKRGRREDKPHTRSSNETATKSSEYQTAPDSTSQHLNRSSEDIFSQPLTQMFDDNFENISGANAEADSQESVRNAGPRNRRRRGKQFDYSIFNVDTEDLSF